MLINFAANLETDLASGVEFSRLAVQVAVRLEVEADTLKLKLRNLCTMYRKVDCEIGAAPSGQQAFDNDAASRCSSRPFYYPRSELDQAMEPVDASSDVQSQAQCRKRKREEDSGSGIVRPSKFTYVRLPELLNSTRPSSWKRSRKILSDDQELQALREELQYLKQECARLSQQGAGEMHRYTQLKKDLDFAICRAEMDEIHFTRRIEDLKALLAVNETAASLQQGGDYGAANIDVCGME